MRISDWSSDVCSSDLRAGGVSRVLQLDIAVVEARAAGPSRSLAVLNIHIEKTLDDDVGAPFKQCLGLSARSEERSVGKECVSTCSSRWSPCHSKKTSNRI